LFLAGSLIVTGCKSAEPAPAGGTTMPTSMSTSMPTTMAAMPTTVEVSVPNAVVPPVVVPTTAPTSVPAVVAPAVPTPAIVATHVVTKAQPYFESIPTSPTAASAGMFASGTKVLVLIPSGAYSKVTAEDGTTGYTATEGIDPISKK
jgi:hypothetical protein